MITVKLTTFGGNTKAYHLPNAYSVQFFLEEFAKSLPQNVLVHASCDVLGISGYVKGNK